MLNLIDVPFGYRNIGLWDQFPVYSIDEIIKVIKTHLGFKHIGISMCAYKNGESYLLYLPFDFDNKNNLRTPWIDGKKLFNQCIDDELESYLTFSGNKGFHVYIKTIPKAYTKRQIKRSQSYYIDKLNLKSFDYKIHGDVSRLMRIIWTLNLNGSWCRLISYNKGNSLDLDEIYYDDRKDHKRHIFGEYGKVNYNRPCVEWLIKNKKYWMKERGKFEPAEDVRLTWAAIRLWRGDTIDEIIEEARNYDPQWDDFDEDKIRNKLEYLDAREWNPHSCESLEQLGYCVPDIYCSKRDINEDLKYLGII